MPNHIIMNFSMELSLLFSLFFFLPFLNASEPKRCMSSDCRGKTFLISFPFWLEPKRPSSCGYPGFNLHCNHHDTVLNIPNSGPFLVRMIDPQRQRIHLNDPEKCLARRLLSFNASESPFSPLKVGYYTFFSCPNKEAKYSAFKPIHCLGNSTTTFFAIPFELIGAMPSSCQIFKTLFVPVTSLHLTTDLNDQDLWLSWDSPNCKKCSDLCGFINNSTLQVKCFNYGNGWIIKELCFYTLLPLFITGFLLLACVCCHSPRLPRSVTVELVESQSVPLENVTPCSN